MYTRKLSTAETLLAAPMSERLRSGYVILQPGQEVGVHSTIEREEMLVILEGTATVQYAAETFEVEALSVAYIPRDIEHNVLNRTQHDLKYIYLVTSLK